MSISFSIDVLRKNDKFYTFLFIFIIVQICPCYRYKYNEQIRFIGACYRLLIDAYCVQFIYIIRLNGKFRSGFIMG